MNSAFRKYGALLLLFVFLFPMAEKEVHAYEHRKDVHCSSTDKHFHRLEHNCDLCDLSLSNSASLNLQDLSFIRPGGDFSFIPAYSGCTSVAAFQDLPARAPPVA